MAQTSVISRYIAVKAFGFNIKIDLLFLAVLLPAALGGFGKEALAISFALMLHEGAHLIAAKALGVAVEDMHILIFGAKITLNLAETAPDTQMLVLLAGPMANFAAAVILTYFHQRVQCVSGLTEFINRQLQLGFFNLMPALPLDGGRVFELWLRERTGFIVAARCAAKAGKILSGVMFCASAVLFILGQIPVNLIIPAVFLYYYADREESDAPLVFVKQIAGKKSRMIKKGVFQARTVAVMEDTPIKNLLYLFNW